MKHPIGWQGKLAGQHPTFDRATGESLGQWLGKSLPAVFPRQSGSGLACPCKRSGLVGKTNKRGPH
ncbi:MAG: hypothetical protein ACLPV4_11655, partial [Solirubrobacteraceae bacterium]